MPFAVRQWPVAPDPRGPLFAFEGWDFGQVPPWKWVVSSFDATNLWAFLNDGFVLPSTFDDGVTSTWFANVPDPGPTGVVLTKFGQPAPTGSPPRTIQLTLSVLRPGPVLIGQGILLHVFPKAIQVFGPVEMLLAGLPIDDVPNPVTITPAKWDFEL